MKLKRLVVGALTVAMVVSVLAGCGKKDKDTSGDMVAADATVDMSEVTLMNDGILTIGCEVGYPPFEDYADDGSTMIGYDIDFANALSEKLGVDINIIDTSFEGILAGIDVNYDVVISALTINDERKENALFSDPYIANYQAVVVPNDSDIEVSSFNDLDGRVVAVQKATTSDELISDYKSTGSIDCTILANEKILSCFTQLDNGEVSVVLCDSTVADGYVAANPDKYKIIYRDDEEPEEFGVAMSLENSSLQAAINEAIGLLKAEGFFDEINEYWFGAEE